MKRDYRSVNKKKSNLYMYRILYFRNAQGLVQRWVFNWGPRGAGSKGTTDWQQTAHPPIDVRVKIADFAPRRVPGPPSRTHPPGSDPNVGSGHRRIHCGLSGMGNTSRSLKLLKCKF